jgi:hypothetical protein
LEVFGKDTSGQLKIRWVEGGSKIEVTNKITDKKVVKRRGIKRFGLSQHTSGGLTHLFTVLMGVIRGDLLGHVRFVLEVLEDEGDPGEMVAVADFMTPGFAAIALTGYTIGSDAAVRIRARAGPLVAGPTVAAIRGTVTGRGMA